MEALHCPHCQQANQQQNVGRNPSGSQRFLCAFCKRKHTSQPTPYGYDAAGLRRLSPSAACQR